MEMYLVILKRKCPDTVDYLNSKQSSMDQRKYFGSSNAMFNPSINRGQCRFADLSDDGS
jgi:hypothetical protein